MKKWSKKKKITILLLFLVLLALFAGLCWKPTTLQVNDLNGTLILSCELQPNKEFTTEQKLIQPDIYTLRIGKTEEKIWLLRSKAECYHGCG